MKTAYDGLVVFEKFGSKANCRDGHVSSFVRVRGLISFNFQVLMLESRPPPMRILIMEDDWKMAGLLKEGLEEENHSACLAFDGRAALELAASSEFDVIMLDLMVP